MRSQFRVSQVVRFKEMIAEIMVRGAGSGAGEMEEMSKSRRCCVKECLLRKRKYLCRAEVFRLREAMIGQNGRAGVPP